MCLIVLGRYLYILLLVTFWVEKKGGGKKDLFRGEKKFLQIVRYLYVPIPSDHTQRKGLGNLFLCMFVRLYNMNSREKLVTFTVNKNATVTYSRYYNGSKIRFKEGVENE